MKSSLLSFTTKQMCEIDSRATASGLSIEQMMTLAGWHMVSIFTSMEVPMDTKVLIVAGKGNKGGDGLSSAKHLINNGWSSVDILLVEDPSTAPAKNQLEQLRNMNASIIGMENRGEINSYEIIIDSMIGYNLKNTPREPYASLINEINNSDCSVISYDIPTGVDATTGECYSPHIMADITLVLAVMKKGLLTESAKKASGEIALVDIGIPDYIYEDIT